MNHSPQPQPQNPRSATDSHRHPSNWRFSVLIRETRLKRGMTQEEAIRCLGGISLERYQRWERGLLTPSAFIQTLSIWRLNTAPIQPAPIRPGRIRKHLGNLSVLALLMALLFAVHAQLGTRRPEVPPLKTMVAWSASQATGLQVSTQQCEAYATRLRATLAQLDEAGRKEVFENLAWVAATVTDG